MHHTSPHPPLWNVTLPHHPLSYPSLSPHPLGDHIASPPHPWVLILLTPGWPYLLILLTLWVARFTGATEIIGDECAIAELSNGTVVLNARDYVNQSQHTWVHPGGIVMFNGYAYVLL